MQIQPFEAKHLDAVVDLSLRAWEPVFESIEKAMGSEIFRAQHPDWRVDQQRAVEDVCADGDVKVWVAVEDGSVLGFVAVKLHVEDTMGEVYMVATDPAYQQRGIGAALTEHAVDWMKEAGMTTAMIETGGDPGHAPARATYEKLGFRLVPIARYFKKL